ncbi:MAG TPA: SagB/ThcOx family dehydrogenase [Geobacteraceae bacterium]|nr:SagB/ThcOx family dehydrogenase [Geobacteraceae bacterium]
MRNLKMAALVIAAFTVACSTWAAALERADISLPAPVMSGGKPLMQALKERQTARAFSDRKLPPQVLSNLLWAAFGINRPESGKRTAPSARNWQEIEIYVILEEGAYLYEPRANVLKTVVKSDLRRLAGTQDFVATAPLNLVYVADTAKMKGASLEDRMLYAGADTGFISQNVYLFCASEGLATVVRGSVERKPLAAALRLPDNKIITLAQTVGYPPARGR